MSYKKRVFTRDFKLNICGEVESGLKTQAQISREYGVGNNLISNWVSQYRKDPIGCFRGSGNIKFPGDEARVKELEAALGRAVLENQILKKANSYLKALSKERRFTKWLKIYLVVIQSL